MNFLKNYGMGYDKRDACKSCWAAPVCSGPCFAVNEFFGYHSNPPLPGQCGMNKTDSEAAVWLIKVMEKTHPEYFFEFLGLNINQDY